MNPITKTPTPATSPINKAKGLQRIILAVRYSWAGLQTAWRQEAAFRQEIGLAIILAPLAVWLGENATQRALLIAVLLLVLIIELLNSAIEAAMDRFGTEHHPLSGQAKDLGSAAVLVALLLAMVVWSLVALERLGH